MRALRAIVLLLTMLVLAAGCASTPGLRESAGYVERNRQNISQALNGTVV